MPYLLRRTKKTRSHQKRRFSSLKNASHSQVVQALLVESSLLAATEKLGCSRTRSSLSKYTAARGICYKELQLLKFLGGATPDTIGLVFSAYQHVNFNLNTFRYLNVYSKSPSSEEQYEDIYNRYILLYTRLSQSKNPTKLNFFHILRFMSAINLAATPEAAATILDVSVDDIHTFMQKEDISLSYGTLSIQSENNFIPPCREMQTNIQTNNNIPNHPKRYNTRPRKQTVTFSESSDSDSDDELSIISQFSNKRQRSIFNSPRSASVTFFTPILNQSSDILDLDHWLLLDNIHKTPS